MMYCDIIMLQLVLQAHPYHIDSLLQLSEVCKMGEDIQTAAELIGERGREGGPRNIAFIFRKSIVQF